VLVMTSSAPFFGWPAPRLPVMADCGLADSSVRAREHEWAGRTASNLERAAPWGMPLPRSGNSGLGVLARTIAIARLPRGSRVMPVRFFGVASNVLAKASGGAHCRRGRCAFRERGRRDSRAGAAAEFVSAGERCGCHLRPNVRGNRRAEARRLGPVGENVPRTANRAKVAYRSASG